MKLKAYLGAAVFFVTSLPSQVEITGEPLRSPLARHFVCDKGYFEAVRRRTGGPEKSLGQVPDTRTWRMDVGAGAFRVLETDLADANT